MLEASMKEDIKEDIKENKFLKTIGNIGFTIFMIIILFFIFITGQSRFTGQEPSLLGHRMYIVDSGSMAPTLPVDSMIIIKEVKANQIKNNDIVTYYAGSGDTRVTHRVVEIVEEGKQFITRGDANNTEDSNILQGDRIVGKVVFKIPYIGKVFRILNSEIGILVLIILGILWVIVPMISKKLK